MIDDQSVIMSPRLEEETAISCSVVKKDSVVGNHKSLSPWAMNSVSIPSAKPLLSLKRKSQNNNKTTLNSGKVSPVLDSMLFKPFDIISKSI